MLNLFLDSDLDLEVDWKVKNNSSVSDFTNLYSWTTDDGFICGRHRNTTDKLYDIYDSLSHI